MKKKFEKPEIEVIEFETAGIIQTSSGMVSGTVKGSVPYTTTQNGMLGGTVGGNTIFK